MRDAVEAFILGWESVTKSLPDAEMVANCARAQWTPLEACIDGIEKASRWVHEKNLAKLGYVRIPGATGTKPAKGGGNLVLARKGSELRGKAEKLGLNKKADAKSEHGKPIASMTEREVRDELKLVQSKISFISRSMPVGQMTPTDPEGWNALHNRQRELHKMLAEHTRDADNAKVAAEELRRKEYNDANEKRKMSLPTKQTRNGWDIATDGARWFLRDPATKEIVYDGTLKRVREVADESPPDVHENLAPKPDGEAKEPWEMTRVDVAIGSHESLGIDWVLGRMKAATGQKKESLKKEYANLQSIKQKAVDDHRAAVESALDAGKPVPAEVLADYPDLVEKYGKANGEKKSGPHPYFLEDLSKEQLASMSDDAQSYMPRRGDTKKLWQVPSDKHVSDYDMHKMPDGREMTDFDIQWAREKAKSDIKNKNSYGNYVIARAEYGSGYDVVKNGRRTLGTGLSLEKARKFALSEIESDLEPKETAKDRVERERRNHKKNVEFALQMKLPVPPEVLAEYPDLVKKYGNGANL